MADIARDDDTVELEAPPRFEIGERVASRSVVRNDGTYCGRDIGEVLVQRGDVGYVRSIGTFLQQFYIYGVDFMERGYRVGMKGRELESLDEAGDDDEVNWGE
jgi:nitrogen fixation protein NifZ